MWSDILMAIIAVLSGLVFVIGCILSMFAEKKEDEYMGWGFIVFGFSVALAMVLLVVLR